MHEPAVPAPATPPLTADAALHERVRARLAAFTVHSAPPSSADATALRGAAVALAITEAGFGAALSGMPEHGQWQREGALVLTRRASGLRRHAGQWALPGGRIDPGETPEATALRELAEEVGLALAPEAVLGRLDDFVTRSGFAITPVVVWAGAAREMAPNPDEVESIHRIPLAELLRPDAPMLDAEEGSAQGSEHPVLRMPVGDSWIAAPTAALLYQFREVLLLGRETRVSHFDQPRFAWR